MSSTTVFPIDLTTGIEIFSSQRFLSCFKKGKSGSILFFIFFVINGLKIYFERLRI